jgi:hypothetical protein
MRAMDERRRRIGLNEAVFREINERIEDLAGQFEPPGRQLEFVCECADVSCTSQIRMTSAEYEDIRRDPTYFAIAPGHETADVEEIIAKRDGYYVVRKFAGEAVELAEETDPRS